MDKIEIRQQIKEVSTVAGLVELLNKIKQDEFGPSCHVISEKQLKHFSSDDIAPKRYRTFYIRKKSGGLREIKAPSYQLAILLHVINILLRSIYEPSDVAMGFAVGRSVADNARMHTGHHYVFNIDLKDFFPSIPQSRVWKRLQLPPFNFSQEIANVLAGLCCSKDSEREINVLPQGAATSPLLTNAICDKLDRRMKGVAKRFGIHYSRYADDMTFSSMHNVYQTGSDFRVEVKRIVEEQGFVINEAKTRLQRDGQRQEVTGLTVNAIANVSRKYISDLRWILHVWETFGYAKAYALFYPKYKHEKGYIKKGEPVMENVIEGKLNYLRMVRGANNPAYQKLLSRFTSLQGLVFVDKETDATESYVYVQPYTVADFQSLFHTAISLEISKKGKLIGRCSIDSQEKVLAVSKSTQKALCPNLECKSVGDVINSDEFEKCYVTLCQDKGKNFWLITKFAPKRSYCMSIQNLKIDPEDLLALWEKKGFDKAASEFADFVQYGQSGETILHRNPLINLDSHQSIDRGEVKLGKEYLLRYFFNNRQLTVSQKKRFLKLLLPIIPNIFSSFYMEELLSKWENDGLDAAVETWKNMKEGDRMNAPLTVSTPEAKSFSKDKSCEEKRTYEKAQEPQESEYQSFLDTMEALGDFDDDDKIIGTFDLW